MITCIFFSLASHASLAADSVPLKELVANAVNKVDGIEPGYSEKWAFTKTTIQNGDVYVENFNPKNESTGQWTLVSFNGKSPGPQKFEEYQKIISERNKLIAAGKKEGKKWLAWMIDMDSVHLMSDTPDELHVSFIPLLKGMSQEDKKKGIGELVISKDGDYVRSVEVKNKEPFSPNFAMKIEVMKSTYAFQKLNDGDYVPQHNTTAAKARIAGVKTIEDARDEKYGSYVSGDK